MLTDITLEPFPKLGRLIRTCIVTEKIDGTNAQIIITDDGRIAAASRKRLITPEDDNFGFARWVQQHRDELMTLGPGRHFGEWWGLGIQRGYDLSERRFSLFNTARWADNPQRPACCSVVPVLYTGTFNTAEIDRVVKLLYGRSIAAPGYGNPEGIVVYHTAIGTSFKWTFGGDGAKGPEGHAGDEERRTAGSN